MTLNPLRINYHFVTYSGKILSLLRFGITPNRDLGFLPEDCFPLVHNNSSSELFPHFDTLLGLPGWISSKLMWPNGLDRKEEASPFLSVRQSLNDDFRA